MFYRNEICYLSYGDLPLFVDITAHLPLRVKRKEIILRSNHSSSCDFYGYQTQIDSVSIFFFRERFDHRLGDTSKPNAFPSKIYNAFTPFIFQRHSGEKESPSRN